MRPENPFKGQEDTWTADKNLHGLGEPKKIKPITLEKITELAEKQRQQNIALEEMREAQNTIAGLNDQAAFEGEIDRAFGNLQETPEERAQRLHEEGRGGTMKVPPQVGQIRKTG